jgi:hypothetical protein
MSRHFSEEREIPRLEIFIDTRDHYHDPGVGIQSARKGVFVESGDQIIYRSPGSFFFQLWYLLCHYCRALDRSPFFVPHD